VDYPEPAEEIALVGAAAPDLPAEIVAKMIAVAGEVRRLFQGEGEAPAAVEVTFSTRTLVALGLPDLAVPGRRRTRSTTPCNGR